MTGQAHWLAAIPVLIGLLVAGYWFWRDRREGKKYQVEDKRFLCPESREKVDATLVRSASSMKVIGVQKCSRFSDPEHVTCDRDCVPGFGPKAA